MLRTLFFHRERSTAAASERRRNGRVRYQVRLATSPHELEQAFALVQQRYSRLGYRSPEAGTVYCPLHAHLPCAHTFIALTPRVEAVLATLTLILDSPFGLSLEGVYASEVGRYRGPGRKLSEITCLATRRRGDTHLLLRLFRAAYALAHHHLGVTDLCIAVHPRHGLIYRHALLFEPIGPVRRYPDCNQAPAVGLRLDLTTAARRYREAHGLGRLGRFFLGRRNYPAMAAALSADLPAGREARFRFAKAYLPVFEPDVELHRRVLQSFGWS